MFFFFPSLSLNYLIAHAIKLFWLRKGLDQTTISEIFQLKFKQLVSNICEQVRSAMLKDFVPKNLGANHLTRDDWLLQNTEMVAELFDLNSSQLALVADGTYCYCDKSSNYYFQKKTSQK